MNLQQQFNLWKWNTKLWLGGWYFTLFQKTWKIDGLDLVVPFDKTDIPFRGQFPIDFYEKQERRFLKKFLPPTATVLELGACLGAVSCITNRLLKNPKHHVVVEANPNMISVIEQNKQRNHCHFNIEHCMVTQQKSNTFFIGKTILMSSNRRATSEKITVEGKTIEDLEAKYQLEFDALVMDIEGGELDFFRENRQKLKQFNVIFTEVHPHPEILSDAEVQECLDILTHAGFKKVVDEQNFWVLTK